MARARLDDVSRDPPAGASAGRDVPEPNPAVLKRLRRLMQALIDGEAPVGDYATAIVRRRDITEIQCGFADRSDAERVGARLRAKSVPPSGDWLSERTLRLDEQAEVALEDGGRPQDAPVPSGRHVTPSPTTGGPRSAQAWPGLRPAGGLGRQSSIIDHAKPLQLGTAGQPRISRICGFFRPSGSARRSRPGSMPSADLQPRTTARSARLPIPRLALPTVRLAATRAT